jgi:TolB-like protein/Tfp pilus assembly protein PilF
MNTEVRSDGDLYAFDRYTLDLIRGWLRNAGGEIQLRRKSFELLRYLVQNAGRLISKDELVNAVWPNVTVGDDSLAQCMSELRNALNDRDQHIIKTVSRRGYLFDALVSPPPPSSAVRQRSGLSDEPGDLPALDAARAPPISEPSVAPRLSIVVLPFANLSNDPEQQYFADGITEDLTTDLSRIENMFVISRNTAFLYRNKPIGAKQIGSELGVRYALEGSVRRVGNQFRVNAQLIDAETDAHLWADRFDQPAEELFALQDEITGRIAVALNSELVATEIERRAETPDAFDCILRGRALNAMPPTRNNYAQVIELFERALALDPRSVEAQNRLAIVLVARVLDQMTSSAAADITRAEVLVQQVSLAAPRSVLTHFAKGQMLRVQRRYAEAIPEYETVIALNRNYVNAFGTLAECKLFAGSTAEMIPLHEQAIRLSPRDPQISIWYFRIGVAHLLQSRIDEAIVWLERARSANTALPYAHSHLASAYVLKGETERAILELAEARKLGDGRYSSFARLKAMQYWGVPNIEALYEATYFAGRRKAGMPEE